MKALDLPPVWLAGYLVVAWALAWVFPQTVVNFAILAPVALIFLGIGAVLMLLAVVQMLRAKTTVIPRRDPNALVTSGIFRFTRNPIYLADMFFLGAGVFWWGSISALPLMWLFKKLIERRFIDDEEIRLQAVFGAEFDTYVQNTKRWI